MIETNIFSDNESAEMFQAFQFAESRQRSVQLDRKAHLLLALLRSHVVVDARLRGQNQIVHQAGHRFVVLVRVQIEMEQTVLILDASVKHAFDYFKAQAE